MRNQRIPFWILVVDLLWVTLALYLAYEYRYGFVVDFATVRECFSTFGETWAAAMLIWTFLTLVMRLDGFNGGWNFGAVVSDLFVGVFLLMVLLLANGYLTRVYQSRLVFLCFGVFAIGGFVGIRCLARSVLGSKRFGTSVRRVVILGGGRIAKELASAIMRHPEMRWQVIGFLCPNSDTNGLSPADEGDTRKVRALDVATSLKDQKVDEIIVAMPNPPKQTLDLVAQCQRSGIRVLAVPQAYELYISRPMLAELDGLPLIALGQYELPAGSQAIRRFTDLIFAPLLLMAVLPLVLVAALTLALRRGKAFRRELRCGKTGKTFWMYRLNVDRKLPALSTYERLLMDLGITEVPQLWNVIRGDMNLVGPRPESPERVKHYSDWQRQRLKTKPGITGLAQIHGLRDQHPTEQKTHYDLQYIQRWSPFLDFSLVLQTIWTLAARVGKPDVKEPAPSPSRLPSKAETKLEEIAYVDHP